MKQIDNPMTFEDTLRYMRTAGIPDTDRVQALRLSRITEQAYAEGIAYGVAQLKKELLRTMYQLREEDTAQDSYEADSEYEADERISDAIDTALEGFPADILQERSEELLSSMFDYGQEEYRKGYFSGIADLILRTF